MTSSNGSTAISTGLSKRREWVAIDHLRQLMPWSRERFDAMVETLRADHQVALERAAPGEMRANAIEACYQVHGQLYHRLRWRHCMSCWSRRVEPPWPNAIVKRLEPRYNKASHLPLGTAA